jgi:opacity protein-like surface antigen
MRSDHFVGRHGLPTALLGALLLCTAASSAEKGSEERKDSWYRGILKASTGFDYSTGDYDDPLGRKTSFWYVPISLKYTFLNFGLTSYDWDEVSIKVTVPYIWCDGNGDVVCGPDSEVGDPGLGPTQQSSGIGDMSVKLAYAIIPKTRLLPVAELSGKIRIPTGDEDENLGLGEPAYTLKLDLSQSYPIGDGAQRFAPFAALGYRFIGDPTDRSLSDYWLWSIGASFRLVRWLNLGLSYEWREASRRPGTNRKELVVFSSLRVGEHFKIGPYGVAGLSKSTADWAIGMTISVRKRID